MKKLLAFLLAAICVFCSGCNDGATSSEASFEPKPTPLTAEERFLVDAKWEGHDGRCENRITFKEDGFFSNNCACGEPVGDGDITEIYDYNEKDQTINLYDCDGELIETAKVLFLDNTYLIIDVWENIYTYANQKNAYVPTMHQEATNTQDSSELFACLAILDYKEGKLTVASHYYDGDAKKDFKLWELEAVDDITFNSITVIDDNGSVSVEDIVLKQEDYQYIGEYYTHGFIEFNEMGKVEHITVYGETVIQG